MEKPQPEGYGPPLLRLLRSALVIDIVICALQAWLEWSSRVPSLYNYSDRLMWTGVFFMASAALTPFRTSMVLGLAGAIAVAAGLGLKYISMV